ncbi:MULTISPECIES: filamentous hemagglutinin N-terminal domain-containing protein [unclassified Polaromonas]|uniref:two-partner secretion domain-containing protein n=1 Tax=unclassified Polaromonas TaxID=2638319 RepID=UPI000F0799FC|nr:MULTISPECIES: filamentous hemagglutinin N-terminal domain-containing protein [unclassified Polaromonas]AYQ29890.1 filamentous hemagglutinin N-terminal domain-containing protein [Polaromonas sp. SP1]QGJ20819.1 filamentous hemagglutinin N-terminal domain-containing protein [Polaromonas sp. Pch-P]
MNSHASINRIYRLVWNAAASLWVAVAENARGGGRAGAGVAGAFILNAALLMVGAPQAWAADAANASVSAGAASIATAGNTTTINQSSQRVAIDWTSLSTAANEALIFTQPNAQAIALNRITGSSPSELLGSLTANGQVFILNPNGVLFGGGSQVNVGGLVASTLSMSNADFMAGNHVFTGSGGSGPVVNQGALNASPGGYLALLAPEVRNEGVMTASLGTALLAAGNKVTLNLDNGSLLGYSIDQGAINALAENKLLIQANGGQVLLSAKAMDKLTTATVNNSGVIEAKTIQNKAGRILLMGDMETGTINVAGTLDASAPDGGDGGFMETSAAHVKVADGAKVTTLANSGKHGTWLIDPTDFTIAAGSGGLTGSGIGATTLATNLNLGNVALATNNGAGTENGDIHVNSAVTWNAGTTLTLSAWRNININASITSQHANGKLALEYGLGAVNAGNTATYNVRAPVNLRAGDNFSTRLGSDGATDPYKVITSLGAAGSTTGTDLQGINGAPALNYVLGADIDASDTVNWNAGAGFDTLGGVGAPGIFEGRFDGLNHKITNLFINRPGDNFVGLFGLTQSTSIRNLGLVGGSITGADFVGAIAGQGCCTTFTNIYSTASVTGNDEVGGLVGELSDGGITDSYATGAVTGADKVGGLVGTSIDGTITRAYSTGLVTATGAAGGLVGEQIGTASTSNSYWNITTSGQATSAGGTGRTSAQMMQAATFAGWDMATQGGTTVVWRIYEGQTGPLLRSFLLPVTLPDTSVVFNGAQQSGAGAAGVTAASGANPGIYNAWSTQEGYDITGGTLTIRPTGSGSDFLADEAYRSAMVYLAGVARAANAQARPGADALAGALSAAAAEAADEGGR